MSWITQMFSRRRLFADLSEEIDQHLEEKIQELVEGGMSLEEASLAARREFGNVTSLKERSREVWQWPWIEHFLMDIRYALRQLRRKPGFTLIAVLILGLGIGATTAIFSVVDAVLIRPLPYQNPGRLVVVWSTMPRYNQYSSAAAGRDFLAWTKRNRVFSSMAGVTWAQPILTSNDHPERLFALRVTPSFFKLLGVKPAIGRAFLPQEGRTGHDREALAEDWQPEGIRQELLVEDLAWLYWLKRMHQHSQMEWQARATQHFHLNQRVILNERERKRGTPYGRHPNAGWRGTKPGEVKFKQLFACLDDLEAHATNADWNPEPVNSIFQALYHICPNAIGSRLQQLFALCAQKNAHSTDPAIREIKELIHRERTSAQVEQRLWHEREALEESAPLEYDDPRLQPLSSQWEIMQRLQERMDRQIHAKTRLLIRLQAEAHAAHPAAPAPEVTAGSTRVLTPSSTNPGLCPPSTDKKNDGTKPNNPLKSGKTGSEEVGSAELSPNSAAFRGPFG